MAYPLAYYMYPLSWRCQVRDSSFTDNILVPCTRPPTSTENGLEAFVSRVNLCLLDHGRKPEGKASYR